MATPRLGLVVEDKPTELSCRLCASTKEMESSGMLTYVLFNSLVTLHCLVQIYKCLVHVF